MCINSGKVKYCEKHNIERSIKKRSNRSDEYYCKQCKNEKQRERNYILKVNNPEWVAKQNYKNNLTKEDKILKSKEYNRNYKKTEKNRDYNLAKLKCKESNLYCVECNINRVYGKKICKKCDLKIRYINANKYLSTCLFCKNTFGIDTKLFNRDYFKRINLFCSLKCCNDYKKYKYELNYNNFKNNEEKINRKREYDRILWTKKRLNNPEALKQAQEKYLNSEKVKAKKLEYNQGKHSNIYCIKCNENRVYGKYYCEDCKKILRIVNKHDFISVCKHCNKEFGLDVKISNYNKVYRLNKYCSIECNKQSIKECIDRNRNDYKKTETYKKAQAERKRNGTYRKRVIKNGNRYELITRRVLFQRFNYICQGCNIKCVHPNKNNYNEHNCATIDHIKPISKGGSHTYDNTQLLCRKCNIMKSNKENYFEHKQRAKQLELQFPLTMVKHNIGEQLALFEQGYGA